MTKPRKATTAVCTVPGTSSLFDNLVALDLVCVCWCMSAMNLFLFLVCLVWFGFGLICFVTKGNKLT